jgi:hypothetical protein
MALRAWPSWQQPDRPESPSPVPRWLQEDEQQRLLGVYRELLGELRTLAARRRGLRRVR